MRITDLLQELLESDSYQPPELHTGDKILKGKFKNSPAEIKGFKKDKHNQPVLKTNKGDVQLFKPRVAKLIADEGVLSELFKNSPVSWKWGFRGSEEVEADFVVGEIQYKFYSYQEPGKEGTWEVEFKVVNPDRNSTRFGVTGTGNAAIVMSTVVDILTAFLHDYKGKIRQLVFSAKEDSRRALYARMVHRLLPTWEYQQQGGEFSLTAP